MISTVEGRNVRGTLQSQFCDFKEIDNTSKTTDLVPLGARKGIFAMAYLSEANSIRVSLLAIISICMHEREGGGGVCTNRSQNVHILVAIERRI